MEKNTHIDIVILNYLDKFIPEFAYKKHLEVVHKINYNNRIRLEQYDKCGEYIQAKINEINEDQDQNTTQVSANL